MKERLVSPKKILTGTIWIPNIEKLNEYYLKIISKKEVMPITIINTNFYNIEKFKEELKENKLGLKINDVELELSYANDLERKLKSWMNQGVEYLLCDGNHRSAAYTLNNLDIPSREIERYSDIRLINKEFEEDNSLGPYIMRENKSMKRYLFYLYRAISSKSILTIDGKISSLIDSGKLKLENDKVIYEANIPF